MAWVLLFFWNSGLYYVSFLRNLPSHGPRAAVKFAEKIQDEYHEHQETIIEGLIEFQKAQCFFMLAIQAAALAVKHGSFLERSSLQQIHNDFAFIDILAAGGYLPIVFVIYTLRTVGHKSVYLLLLSGCTIGVSAAALLSREIIPMPPVGMSSSYSQCGNVSPIAFCYGWNFRDSDFGPDRTFSSGFKLKYETPPVSLSVYPLIYSLMIFLLLLSEYSSPLGLYRSSRLWVYMAQDEWLSKEKAWIEPLSRSSTQSTATLSSSRLSTIEAQLSDQSKASGQTRVHAARNLYPNDVSMPQSRHAPLLSLWRTAFGSPRKLRSRLFELFNLAIFVLFLYFIGEYMKALAIFRSSAYKVGWANVVGIPIDLSNWTFGQLVAITVWVPPLIQYAYLEFCKSSSFLFH